MANRYWVGGTGTWDNTAGTKWATTSGGAGGASAPNSGDDVFFDASSGSGTVTAGGLARGRNVAFTGFTGTLANTSGVFAYGSVTLVAGMTYSGNGGIFFDSFTGTAATFTTAGKVLGTGGLEVTDSGSPRVVTLQDNLTATNGLVKVTSSTLDTNGKTITAGNVNISGTFTRALTLGSSLITLTAAGTVWDATVVTNLTFNAGTSTIKLTDASSSSKTFAGGGKTYATVWNAPGAGLGTFIVTGANTYSELKDDGSAANTVQLPAGVTQTVTTLNINGSGSNRKLLRSSSAGSQATISKASGTVNATLLDLKDMAATGGATFNATFSINSGNNSGWNITQPASGSQAVFIF